MAARACAAGVDGMSILTTDDPVEALVALAVAHRSAEILASHRKELAILIRNEVGGLF